jgi:long-chain acyl-CoA synthetase
VVGLPDERWGELVVAFVVPQPGASPDPGDLAQFCGDRLPAYMKPRRIEFREALPRNPVGKILRRELRQPAAITAAS